MSEKSKVSVGERGTNMERDWAIIKWFLLVVFLSYIIIYTVEAM